MGFDNISELDEMDGGNKIITVEQNFFELGVKAGETVLREINGEMPGIKYIVPVKIAVRNWILKIDRLKQSNGLFFLLKLNFRLCKNRKILNFDILCNIIIHNK